MPANIAVSGSTLDTRLAITCDSAATWVECCHSWSALARRPGSSMLLASWRTITAAASAPSVRKPTRWTAARTLVTSLPLRL
jgi:hypothetical protein